MTHRADDARRPVGAQICPGCPARGQRACSALLQRGVTS
jgi:hypothetical protein